MSRTLLALALCASALCAFAAPGHAQIVGGSALLTNADLTTLEGYLGEGPLQLTNIFTKTTTNGKTSADFHAAADGQGRTFSVLQVLSSDGLAAPEIIGGYDPQSWDSSDHFHYTYNDADRTAFLFNLTTGVKQDQNKNGSPSGVYQTYNHSLFGPTFGGAYDLNTDSHLSGGYVFNYSYGGTGYGENILGNPNGSYFTPNVVYGRIEVFTIRASAVPEPGAYAMLVGTAVFGGSLLRRRRRK